MPGEIEPHPTVQKTKADEVAARETPKRAHYKIQDAGLAPLRQPVLRKVIAIDIDLLEQTVQILDTSVEQFATQASDGTVHAQLVVGINATPLRLAALPKARLAVGIPIAMTNPASQVERAARERIRREGLRATGPREPAHNLLAQFGRNNLIGVQPEYPRLRGFGGGGILLGDMPLPRLAEDPCAMVAGDFLCAVAHVLVEHDDDIAGPAGDALQRPANAMRLHA